MKITIPNLYRCTLASLFAFAFALTPFTPATASEAAPDFSVQTRDGQISLGDLRGKVVYLDFWASWCVPCRASFKWLNEMHTRLAVRGLVILAVNVDEEPALAQAFLEEHPASFRIAYDPTGNLARTYALKGMPSSFIIDASGRLSHTHVGFREKDKAHLEAHIAALLDDASQTTN